MRIIDVEKATGLSKKAIRLYESKGLITISRTDNGYRDYTEQDIIQFKRIKLLRLAGISISDIKLLNAHIISPEDLIKKRKAQLEEEYGSYSKQFAHCIDLMQHYKNEEFDCNDHLDEDGDGIISEGRFSVGLDIGTTSISAVVINLDQKKSVEYFTVPNSFGILSDKPFFALQNADAIFEKAKSLLKHIIKNFSGVSSIGITGQMHGILYINKNGKACSPLFTWQDNRANQIYQNNETYCEYITRLTGERIATGYGFATHFFNLKNALIPTEAVGFCSIMDYIAANLTQKFDYPIHSSIAASFGFFDAQKSNFKIEKLAMLGITEISLPKVTNGAEAIGYFDNIPVSVPIGDNQASFFGSVKDPESSILINVGTGSQISVMSDFCKEGFETEVRPLLNEHYLICGSALCGGASYALLESFFRSFLLAAQQENTPVYEVMNTLADEQYAIIEDSLYVDTRFCGTRSNPLLKGSIENISLKNFTPSHLILGVIKGMCTELQNLFAEIGTSNKTMIVASGNAVQKISIFKRVLSDVFQMSVQISQGKEEAATGSALFSALSAKYLESMQDFSKFIHYKN